MYYNNTNGERFMCLCNKGYYWSLILKKCLPLENICSIYKPCGTDINRGECKIDVKNHYMYKCACRPAFTGKFCHIPQNPCLNRHNDDYCGSDTFECVRDPNNLLLGYRCKCEAKPGYEPKSELDPSCVDKNECNSYLEICKNGGKCINNKGSYECACLPGYEGNNCEIKIDHKNYGQWQDWKSWEPCSVKCGIGHQISYRNCSVPYMCSGSDSRTKECLQTDCKKDSHSELFATVLYENDLEKSKMLEFAYTKMLSIYKNYFNPTNSSVDVSDFYNEIRLDNSCISKFDFRKFFIIFCFLILFLRISV